MVENKKGTADAAMTRTRKILWTGLALACAVAFVSATAIIVQRKARAELQAQGDRQLQLIALDLESALDKFETLPYVLSYLPDAVHVLSVPGDPIGVARLNQSLQAIQLQAKVAAIYLMDRDGLTLASSNWRDDPVHTFIGRSFAYRPYFREAIGGRAGHFYGIGNATGEPGYFLTQPVYATDPAHRDALPIGAIAVKISLDEFERTWQASQEPIALADRSGIVFLANRSAWKYHSLQKLDAATMHELERTQQYGGHNVPPISALSPARRAGFDGSVSRPVGPLGWKLMLFPSEQRIANIALLSVVASALLVAVAALSLWAAYQRRRRLEERRASRDALQRAADELESIIFRRTQELVDANQNIENKYAKLKQTEHMLRSTQNELVQAGKLAMLGQMAAGITHELNQPLAAIRAFADNAGTLLARGQIEKAVDNLGHIGNASARMGVIIGQLKGFSRISHGALVAVDLNQSIRASVFLLQSEFDRHRVELHVDLQQHAFVSGDAVRTEQVLINMLRNALDAVETCFDKKVWITLTTSGTIAVIKIRDSGPGIADDAVQHLFAPFFTTKPSGKGLGLGLAISSSIVQAMNGELIAHNHPDGGAEFALRLPLYQTQKG